MDVQDAVSGEKVLKQGGYEVKLIAPPPELRKGCDLALEINLVEQPGIKRFLMEEGIPFVSVAPINVRTSELLRIVKVKDFGEWTMVKAGNMKLTFENKSGLIVNTSGGGCPDIPFLHSEMIGKTVYESPKPKNIGFTLCALMLDRALEESLVIWQGRSKEC
jgi:hypothetical protein